MSEDYHSKAYRTPLIGKAKEEYDKTYDRIAKKKKEDEERAVLSDKA